MKIGFTGTRDGMTNEQLNAARLFLTTLDKPVEEAHHGDCIGSDADFNGLVTQWNMTRVTPVVIVIHPPLDFRHRAHCGGKRLPNYTFREPLTHLARNRKIVNETDLLIATPKEPTEQYRGGTWYTVRYAAKRGKPIIVIPPNGRVCEWEV